MFDFDPDSKRVKLALRFFTYGVMTISTVVISTILVFVALGYRLDRDFHFTQGGLVQFRSTPVNASVTIDGALQGFHTPDKLNMAAGKHTVAMGLDGYQAWNKSFNLAAGQLLWLNYARLIPRTIDTTTVRQLDNMADAVASPDRHWTMLQLKQDAPDFVLADISDEKSPKFTALHLPDAQLIKKDNKYGVFTIVEWDLKSQYLLIKQVNGDTTEFIRLDRSKPADAINITNLFGFAITDAHFSGNDANIIFANTNGVLRRLDVGSKSASGALVNNLKNFIVYGSGTIAFTADQEQTVGDAATKRRVLGTWHNDKETIIRSTSLDTDFVYAYNQYDNHEYLAFGATNGKTITLLRDPSDSAVKEDNAIFALLGLDAVPKWLSFSNNGRMVVAQNGDYFATYDIEVAKAYQTHLDLGAKVTAKLEWLDDFYVWAVAGNRLHIVEFDGTNEHSITSAQPGFGVALSSSGRRLFSVDKNSAGIYLLQSSRLTTNPSD
jgi:hypothetical protein